ncbi:MAG: T9SS type A sorting domain-containing protein [Bacteroidales bacterium]|nr:T9SS type A sorting domain-containing protein [Bacteroidales bacterium]
MKRATIQKLTLLAAMLAVGTATAQQAIVPCGNVVTGLHGSFSYSAGQIAMQRSTSTDSQWRMAEGVVQPMQIEQESIEGIEPLNIAIAIGPNPTEGKLHISATGEIEGEIRYEILSIHGQNLMVGAIKLPHAHLNLSPLPAGTYLLLLRDGNARQSRYRIVKN